MFEIQELSVISERKIYRYRHESKSRIVLIVIVDMHLGNLVHVAPPCRELEESVQSKDGDGDAFIFVCVLKPCGKYTCQVSSARLQAPSYHLQHIARTSYFLICKIRLQSAPPLTQGFGNVK